MRERLREKSGARGCYTGTFSRFGAKSAYKGPPLKTVLLVELKDEMGREVCDHLWFNFTKEFEAANLQPGDQVRFNARSKPYWKGYRGHRYDDDEMRTVAKDYKLSHPTKVTVVRRASDEGDQPVLFEKTIPSELLAVERKPMVRANGR